METPEHSPLAMRSIAFVEIAKGLLALAAAFGVLSLRHTDLHAAASAFLIRHGVNPERHFGKMFIDAVASATNYPAGEIAAVAIAYALVRLVEGYGLWRGRHWAEWFAVISLGIYLPLELQHFAHHATLLNAVVILINIAIMIYLGNCLRQEREARKKARLEKGA
jgi:uncharacterized membrane protein (DUF2068 family)